MHKENDSQKQLRYTNALSYCVFKDVITNAVFYSSSHATLSCTYQAKILNMVFVCLVDCFWSWFWFWPCYVLFFLYSISTQIDLSLSYVLLWSHREPWLSYKFVMIKYADKSILRRKEFILIHRSRMIKSIMEGKTGQWQWEEKPW